MSMDARVASQSRLQRTGAHILGGGGGSRPSSGAYSAGRETPPPSVHSQDPFPATNRSGRIDFDKSGSLTPYAGTAQNLPSLKNVQIQRQRGRVEAATANIWSDSVKHFEEQWPAHAIPLFIFTGRDRPRPKYREELKFTLRDEKYVNFGLRLKCGTGDRYMGGSVGLVYSDDSSEALPGTEGQLAMITGIIVNPDNSVIVSAVGDLNFTVVQSWMPRGLRGMQLAFVDVLPPSEPIHRPVLQTCAREKDLQLFARLVDTTESLAHALCGDGPFTVFVPTDVALRATLARDEDQLLRRPDLEALMSCYVCTGCVRSAAMYSGRVLQAIDGTMLMVTFITWPKGSPRVNDVPIEHMDIQCSNGVIHIISGPLMPNPAVRQRGR